MLIGLFTDSHYCRDEVRCRTRRPILSLQKIRQALEYFQSAGVDMCICLGDLTDSSDTKEESKACLQEIMDLVHSCSFPFCCVPGNHDYVDFTGEVFYEMTDSSAPPYSITTPTHQLIVLDANYRGDYRRFDVAGVEWTDSNLPPEQVSFLQKALEQAEKPCLVLIHENLDEHVPKDHIVHGADRIRGILEKSGKVAMVIQGHYHAGGEHEIQGIRYATLPAMCEGEENRFALLRLDENGVTLEQFEQ